MSARLRILSGRVCHLESPLKIPEPSGYACSSRLFSSAAPRISLHSSRGVCLVRSASSRCLLETEESHGAHTRKKNTKNETSFHLIQSIIYLSTMRTEATVMGKLHVFRAIRGPPINPCLKALHNRVALSKMCSLQRLNELSLLFELIEGRDVIERNRVRNAVHVSRPQWRPFRLI